MGKKMDIEIAPLIAEVLYPGYSFRFLFDNATSHSIYVDDALRAKGGVRDVSSSLLYKFSESEPFIHRKCLFNGLC